MCFSVAVASRKSARRAPERKWKWNQTLSTPNCFITPSDFYAFVCETYYQIHWKNEGELNSFIKKCQYFTADNAKKHLPSLLSSLLSNVDCQCSRSKASSCPPSVRRRRLFELQVVSSSSLLQSHRSKNAHLSYAPVAWEGEENTAVNGRN